MSGIASLAKQDGSRRADPYRHVERLGDLAARTFAELGFASASDISNLQGQIDNLGRRDKELADGIAISLALTQPILLPSQTFALRAGLGNFDGSNAVGISR